MNGCWLSKIFCRATEAVARVERNATRDHIASDSDPRVTLRFTPGYDSRACHVRHTIRKSCGSNWATVAFWISTEL